ncbi:MAG: T9SS type A sorting domain-containing protein [Bacteroidota bacterium]
MRHLFLITILFSWLYPTFAQGQGLVIAPFGVTARDINTGTRFRDSAIVATSDTFQYIVVVQNQTGQPFSEAINLGSITSVDSVPVFFTGTIAGDTLQNGDTTSIRFQEIINRDSSRYRITGGGGGVVVIVIWPTTPEPGIQAVDSARFTITFEALVNSSNWPKETFQLLCFPNPVHTQLFFRQSPQNPPLEYVRVQTLLGQVLQEKHMPGNSLAIETLPPGTYVLSLKNTKGATASYRFIKQ